MYQKYQDGLIAAIKKANVNAEEYAGELEKPQEGNFKKSGLPIVYIDFVEDDTSKPTIIDIHFSLYIVHISFSKNKDVRSDTKKEMLDLLKDVYKSIAFKPIEDSEMVVMGKLKKIYDASAAGGYLTVYKKSISMKIPNPILGGL